MMKAKRVLIGVNVLVIATLACSLTGGATSNQPDLAATIKVESQTLQAQSAAQAQTTEAPVPAPSQSNVVPVSGGTATPVPLIATIMASHHAATPADAAPSGALNYDVDSSGTGPEHRAPYGDSYNINLFERPFTLADMTYMPQLDIGTFQLAEDATWYYVTIDLSGGDMNDPTYTNYGVELDTDHDGYGDFLVWGSPPYTSQWLAETVQVYQDTNHDTGGASAEKSDAPFPGNGYDKLMFDRGQGEDTDLAWVRLNPQVSSNIQFAFKRSLAGNAFMWGVWADSGLRDPSKFNYNDRFTEEQAGSPEKSEKYYPIKAINQVDNTCWVAVGFRPTGYEPHLCPTQEPRPPKRKAPPPPPPAGCTPFWLCFPIILHPPTPIPPPK